MERQTFSKNERIRNKRDYLTVYQQGVRSHSKHFTIITCRNPSGESRLGVTVSKKVGNSVKRNRIKRLLREFFRLHKAQFSPVQDTVIVARGAMPALTYQDVCMELGNLLKKISHA
jgi:ribonuclease P protein component